MLNSLFVFVLFVLCCSSPVSRCFADGKVETRAGNWRLQIDNDAMASGGRDRNYTGGITFSQSGRRVVERAFSLDGLLGKIDGRLGIGTSSKKVGHAMQIGLLAFTPEHVSVREPVFDDQPYSNLVFLANSHQWIANDKNSVTRSMLLVGLFGTNTAKAVQSGLHDLIDVEEANGWDNQISDGGEPTFRYSVSRTSFLKTNYKSDFASYDISTTLEGNVGYTTDVNAGISLRFGRIHSLGWLSLPEPSDHFTAAYAPLISPEGAALETEYFFLAGVNLRLRAYNVLLQGQFRDSKVTYSYSQLNALIGEAWIGAGASLSNGWHASFVIRGRTEEFDAGQSANHVWGGLTVSKIW